MDVVYTEVQRSSGAYGECPEAGLDEQYVIGRDRWTEAGQYLLRKTRHAGKEVDLFVVIVHKISDNDRLPRDSIRRVNAYYPCTINEVEGLQITPAGTVNVTRYPLNAEGC